MDNFINTARTFFTGTWNLLTGVSVPGIGISFAGLFAGIFIIGISIKIFVQFLMQGGNN